MRRGERGGRPPAPATGAVMLHWKQIFIVAVPFYVWAEFKSRNPVIDHAQICLGGDERASDFCNKGRRPFQSRKPGNSPGCFRFNSKHGGSLEEGQELFLNILSTLSEHFRSIGN